ncbi:MAG: site-specific integrase [Candidatus Polarisedimenticolaceae bacterium]|nr:site-specific integrase [Candidatus Polarisedimenticolaceae bacterium]
MATITKTPSKTWKAIIRKRGWPTTIKTFRTKRDAQDWARRTEDDMVRGAYIDRAPSESTTLKSAMNRYLAEVSPTKSTGTKRRETVRAKPLLEELGDYALVAMTPDLIGRYRDKQLIAGKSNNTVRLELALLSHMFTVAIQEWRMGLIYNPVAAVRKPSPGPGRNRRLQPNEERTLLTACDQASNPMLGWIVRIAIYTGMRAGEIQTLRRGQVDLTRRVVRLNKTKNGSARTVPLLRQATEVLQEALAHPIRPMDIDLVFWGEPGRDGQRRPYEYSPAWRRALKRAGITDLRFHDLRHEAVSRLVEAGLGDQEVAAISGHKSMQMLRRYTHLRAEDLVERLDQLMDC